MHPSLLVFYGVRRWGVTPAPTPEAGAALP
jgi:hypothetical protein